MWPDPRSLCSKWCVALRIHSLDGDRNMGKKYVQISKIYHNQTMKAIDYSRECRSKWEEQRNPQKRQPWKNLCRDTTSSRLKWWPRRLLRLEEYRRPLSFPPTGRTATDLHAKLADIIACCIHPRLLYLLLRVHFFFWTETHKKIIQAPPKSPIRKRMLPTPAAQTIRIHWRPMESAYWSTWRCLGRWQLHE